jgi:predicted phosphodiesterase
MLKFTKYNGILFVGDPHLWSEGPGKRLDSDIFTQIVLNKINQAVDIALRDNLYLIFLGDLFHMHTENNIDMLTKLTRILKKFPEPCATIEGNHEKSKTKLSDDVALTLLREAGTIYTLEKSEIWAKFEFNNSTTVYLGGSPYGDPLPTQVLLPKNELNKDTPIIWLSHHNLDFGETYPGVIPVKEIKGVKMLVNGHIHKTKKPLKLGGMTAHNPGNITRLSTDCKEHIPSVWKWTPKQGYDLEPIDLIFEKHVFNLIGKQIEVPTTPAIIADEVTPQQTSNFVIKMQQQANEFDPSRTDDGVYLKENIRALAKAMNLDESFTNDMIDIADETISDTKSN